MEELIKKATILINQSKEIRKDINRFFLPVVSALFGVLIVFVDPGKISSFCAKIVLVCAIVLCAISLICFCLAVISPYFSTRESLRNTATDIAEKIYPDSNFQKENKWSKADALLKTGIGTFIVTIALLVVFLIMNVF